VFYLEGEDAFPAERIMRLLHCVYTEQSMALAKPNNNFSSVHSTISMLSFLNRLAVWRWRDVAEALLLIVPSACRTEVNTPETSIPVTAS
jgi:hypothetical protein